MNHLKAIDIIKNCPEEDGKILLELFDDWDNAWHGNAPSIKGYCLEYPEDDDELKKICELFGYNVIINHVDYDLGWASETLYLINGLDGLEDEYEIQVLTFDEFKDALVEFIETYMEQRCEGQSQKYYDEESEWIWLTFKDTLQYLEC